MDRFHEFVEARAHGRCEYCDSPVGRNGELEHIRPRARGGRHHPENLAWACRSCNRNKGSAVESVDPLTGRVEPLFNPRRSRWADHFLKRGRDIVGRSPSGRATATLLFRLGGSTPENTLWDWLTPIDDEILRGDLARMRVRRLTNEFTWLARNLQGLIIPSRLDARQRTHAAFVRYLLQVEICLTRVTIADIDRGLRLATEALHHFGHIPLYRAQIESNRSVLLQQLGTALQFSGLRHEATRARLASVLAFASGGGGVEKDRRSEMLRMLSRRAVIAPDEVRVTRDDFRYAIDAAADGLYRPLLGIADVLIANRAGSPVDLDEVAEELWRVLQTAGYGQDIDHAGTAVVRRRWWGIEAARESALDLDLLTRDIALWRGKSLFNEMRELAVLLHAAPDAAEIVRKSLRRRGDSGRMRR